MDGRGRARKHPSEHTVLNAPATKRAREDNKDGSNAVASPRPRGAAPKTKTPCPGTVIAINSSRTFQFQVFSCVGDAPVSKGHTPTLTIEISSRLSLLDLLDSLFELHLTEYRRHGETLCCHAWSLLVRDCKYHSGSAFLSAADEQRQVHLQRTEGRGPRLQNMDMGLGTKLHFEYDWGSTTKVVLRLARSTADNAAVTEAPPPRPCRAPCNAPPSESRTAADLAAASAFTAAFPNISRTVLDRIRVKKAVFGFMCQAVQGGAIEHRGSGIDLAFAPSQFGSLEELLVSFDEALSPAAHPEFASYDPAYCMRFVFPADEQPTASECKLSDSMKCWEKDLYGPKMALSRLTPPRRDELIQAKRRSGFNASAAFPRTAARFCGASAIGCKFSWFSLEGEMLRVHTSEMEPTTRTAPVGESPLLVMHRQFDSAYEIFAAVERAWPAADTREALQPAPEYWRTSKKDAASVPRPTRHTRFPSGHMLRKVQHLLRHTSRTCKDGADCTIGAQLANAHVLSVERVENHSMWQAYASFRATAAKRAAGFGPAAGTRSRLAQTAWGEKSRPIHCDVEDDESFLFHGTSYEAAKAILDGGFNMPGRTRHGVGRYGDGLYFTDESCKSHQYSRPHAKDGVQCLLYCRVATGKTMTYQPDEVDRRNGYLQGMSRPTVSDAVFRQRIGAKGAAGSAQSQETWDTVNVEPAEGKVQVHREVVVFSPQQVYPEFLILYRTTGDRRVNRHKTCACIFRCRVCASRGAISRARPQWFDCWSAGCDGHSLAPAEMPGPSHNACAFIHNQATCDVSTCEEHLHGAERPEACCAFCRGRGFGGTPPRRRECRQCDGEGMAHTFDWKRCFRCHGSSKSRPSCRLCAGTGRLLGRNISECFKCESKGRYEATAGGTSVCDACNGRSVLKGTFSKCFYCDGDGSYTTEGSEVVRCDRCHGKGALEGVWDTCHKCDTNGHYKNTSDRKIKCEECQGNGAVTGQRTKCFACEGCGCDACGVSGSLEGVWSECAKCEGDGSFETDAGDKTRCGSCAGKGALSGRWCQCDMCEGQGPSTCEACHGHGSRAGFALRQCDCCDTEFEVCPLCDGTEMLPDSCRQHHHPEDDGPFTSTNEEDACVIQ